MLYKFLYIDDIATFETEASSLDEAIKKLKRLDGVLYNPSNLVINIKQWRINCSMNINSNESIKLKDKTSF
jgi:hypothetical protein